MNTNKASDVMVLHPLCNEIEHIWKKLIIQLRL